MVVLGESSKQTGLGVGRPEIQPAPSLLGKEKEIAVDTTTEKERTLVIDMTSARQAARPRFLAVGLFLSTLLVSSDVLMERMKKVWRVRGHAEASQIEAEEGRKFVIEFSEEGDRGHAVRGGPWQYKLDVFLVEAMEAGVDPTSVQFTHVPMWVQFHGIPFYLLTKKLAWELGWEIGTALMIDNNSRGNMNEKFLRARVQLPLYAALRDRVILADIITGEKVKVQVCYERLPNFCLFCGYIGHMEARCDLPVADRKVNFNMEMRVQAVHFADPRAWYLPDAMGQAQAQPVPTVPWRASKPTPAIAEASVEKVVEGVAQLKVTNNKHESNLKMVAVATGEMEGNKTEAAVVIATDGKAADNDYEVNAGKEVIPGEAGEQLIHAPCNSDVSSNMKDPKSWKRKKRSAIEVQSTHKTLFVPLEYKDDLEGAGNGRVCQRSYEDEENMMPAAKKGYF
jgi:cytochrome c